MTAATPRFEVHTGIRPLEAPWRHLEAGGFGSLYQTYLWCLAWQETIGAASRVEPRIVVVRGGDGQVILLLPFQIRRRQGARVLEWFGAPQHNYGMGLIAADFMPSAEAWLVENWPAICEAAGPYDAACLAEIPASLNGVANPFAAIANLAGANRSYRMALEPEFDSLHARKRDSESRRSARKRERNLGQIGEVRFGLPPTKPDIHRTLDIMFAQQESRMSEIGVYGLFGGAERAFLHRLVDLQDDKNPVLAPYEFTCGGQTLAVMLGGLHGKTYWALVSSLAGGSLRKHSPGELALRHTIAACCEGGLSSFDFSPGDSGYKLAWADEVVHLRCQLAARTWKGLAWSFAYLVKLFCKRQVKGSPMMRNTFNRLRRTLLGTSPKQG